MSNIDIAKAYINAVQTGGQAALGSIFHPNVVWHQPGNNKFSGTKNGMAELGAMLGGMMEASAGSFAISKVKRYLANGDLVAVEIEFSGQRDGLKLAQPGVAHQGRQGRRGVAVFLRPGTGRPVLGQISSHVDGGD